MNNFETKIFVCELCNKIFKEYQPFYKHRFVRKKLCLSKEDVKRIIGELKTKTFESKCYQNQCRMQEQQIKNLTDTINIMKINKERFNLLSDKVNGISKQINAKNKYN